ncbi:MAG: prepilin-type N-terminal cleavage/methylation domain-containing protein [Syntrophaceae bacterium]|nr:prepilin-type N-terminal cleavage/methylation domain-containing protein [Syntrophaceae bacterium]
MRTLSTLKQAFYELRRGRLGLSKQPERPGGFTLFEVLITLAILGVVLSLLYLTFHQSMTVMAEVDDRAEVIREGRMVLERMAGELKGTFSLIQKEASPAFRTGFVGRPASEGNDSLDRLDFTARLPSFSDSREGGWGFFELGYFLDRSPGRKGLTLFRRQDDGMDRNLLQGGRSVALCDGVRSLAFSYYDRQGRKGKEWNTLEGERRNLLPSRVEIQLKMEDSRGRVHEFRTQVYLPMSG